MRLRLSFMFSLAVILATNIYCAPLGAQSVETQASIQEANRTSSPKKAGFRLNPSSYEFAEHDWVSLIARLHTSNPPSNAQISSFVMAMIEGMPDSIALTPEEAALAGTSVCSAGFFKISGSDSESLIASIDVNGRHFCNDTIVIHHDSDKVTIQDIFAWYVDEVKDIVHDIDKNGKNELVIPSSLSGYEGAGSCMASWSQIYVMQAGTLVDKSSEFKSFYRDRLDSLNAGMQQVVKRDQDDNGDSAVCTQMEMDKIKRYLGISPDAGKDQAIAWIKSGNEYMRRKGFAVLQDIGDKESKEILQAYTKDPNPNIANEAKFALDNVKP